MLHECVHQKLYDIQATHAIYRPGYDVSEAELVRPPWHNGAAWSFDRALSAAHVYVHLAAFYHALAADPDTPVSADIIQEGRERASVRARFLLDAVAELPGEVTPSGAQFIHWLRETFHSAVEPQSPVRAGT